MARSIQPHEAQVGDQVYVYEEWGIVCEVDVYFDDIMEYYVEFPDRYETVTSDDVEQVRRSNATD